MDVPPDQGNLATSIPAQTGTSNGKILPNDPCFSDIVEINARSPSNNVVIDTAPYAYPRMYKFVNYIEGRDKKDVLERNEQLQVNREFVVRDESACEFIVFPSCSQYKRWLEINPGRRTLHEVIPDGPQKLKFDIDAVTEQLDTIDDFSEEELAKLDPKWQIANPRARKARLLISTIMEAISLCSEDLYGDRLQDDEFAASDSSDPTKFSRHIVITSFHVANCKEAKYFTERMVKFLPEDYRRFVDTQVNSSCQNFRLPGCHKKGSTRIKNCFHGTPDSMFITQVGDTPCMPAICDTEKKQATALELTDNEVATVLNLAAIHTDGLVFSNRNGGLFSYKRVRPGNCIICNRVHDRDNSLYVTVSGAGFVMAHCFRNPGSRENLGRIFEKPIKKEPKPIGDTEITNILTSKTQIPESISVLEYNEQYLRPYDFMNKYDTLLIKANMGTGKTKALLDYIEHVPDSTHIVLVSFRRSFSSEITTKLGPQFVDYRNVTGEIKDKRVVIQFESLHRLFLPVGCELLVILDESESVIGQIENRTIKIAQFDASWEKFCWLMVNAPKLILMDANAGIKSYTLLTKTRKRILMHYNKHTPSDQATDYYYNTRSQIFEAIRNAAANAKEEPFVLVCTSKKQADIIVARIRDKHPALRIKYYSADSTEKKRRDFDDVNTAWADVDILVYTSTITAGCSFERVRFMRLYAYFSTMSVDYQVAVQMMGRVRDISSREYHIFIDDRGEKIFYTRRQLERALVVKKYIYDLATNPTNAKCVINSKGKRVWKDKDLYYYLHLENLIHRVQSRTRFKAFFQQLRHEAGVKLIDSNPEITISTKANCKAHYKKGEEQYEHYLTCVAHSPVITDEQAHDIANAQFPTVEQKHAKLAYDLAVHYDVNREAITTDFIETYGKPRMRRVFKLLNAATSRQTIKMSIDAWQQNMDHPERKRSIDDLSKGNDLLRCMYCVDILNEILTANDGITYCDHKRFGNAIISRADLVAGIERSLVWLRKKASSVSVTFSIDRSKVINERVTVKSQVEFINSLLMQTFGLKFIGTRDGKRKSAEFLDYRLTFEVPFTWDANKGSYIIPKDL